MQTTADMPPYFAAAGHRHYTKAASLNLQQVLKIDSDYDVYKKYEEGHHVFR